SSRSAFRSRSESSSVYIRRCARRGSIRSRHSDTSSSEQGVLKVKAPQIVIGVVAALALAGGGFAAGMTFDKAQTPATSTTGATGASGARGGTGARGGFGGG